MLLKYLLFNADTADLSLGFQRDKSVSFSVAKYFHCQTKSVKSPMWHEQNHRMSFLNWNNSSILFFSCFPFSYVPEVDGFSNFNCFAIFYTVWVTKLRNCNTVRLCRRSTITTLDPCWCVTVIESKACNVTQANYDKLFSHLLSS